MASVYVEYSVFVAVFVSVNECHILRDRLAGFMEGWLSVHRSESAFHRTRNMRFSLVSFRGASTAVSDSTASHDLPSINPDFQGIDSNRIHDDMVRFGTTDVQFDPQKGKGGQIAGNCMAACDAFQPGN